MPLGLDDGSIRVQILESREISKLDNYWSMNMHDNHYGAVTGICLSFDEKFLLSVGNDGNFFVYSFMDEEKLKTLIGKHKAEVAKQVWLYEHSNLIHTSLAISLLRSFRI